MSAHNLLKQYECAICTDLLVAPVQLAVCGHRFCGECYSEYENMYVIDRHICIYQKLANIILWEVINDTFF